MSAPSQSVFISYAREDLAAARRIADALGAFEVEVWFDEAGLEGGDAWDQKIRRQIKECSLFIPIISAQTQVRREAYFRLEWKLAEERTHLMAEGTAFLLPIAIDDTIEDSALVPESFRRTQWTRLPRGVPNTPLVDRVRALLAQQRSHVLPSVAPGMAQPVQPRRKWPLVAFVLALAVGGSLPFWSHRNPASAPPVVVEKSSRADKSIAVLPFTNMSDDKENAYFADGMHEEILTSLASLGELKVISRTSVMQYRGTTKLVRQIATELGVTYVLEGSVRRAGNTVRVTSQLINARTDEHLWAKSYDRELKDIFAIQSALAVEITDTLKAVLTPQDMARLQRAPTDNLTAYDAYLKSKEIARTETYPITAVNGMVLLLESAVKYDPKFAPAWIQLGYAHLRAYTTFDRSDVRLAKAKAGFEAAEQIDPDSVDVIGALANYYLTKGDSGRAAEQGSRLTRLYPNHAETFAFLAHQARLQGNPAEAMLNYRKARALDPWNSSMIGSMLRALGSRRNYAEAEALLREITPVVPPNNAYQAYLRALIPFHARGDTSAVDKLLAGPPPEAWRTDSNALFAFSHWAFVRGDAKEVIRLWEQSGPKWLFVYGFRDLAAAIALVADGQPDRARPLLEKNRDQVLAQLVSQPENVTRLFDLALTYAVLGDRPGVMAMQQKALNLSAGMRDTDWDDAVLYAWLGDKDQAVAELTRQLPLAKGGYSDNVHEIRRNLFLWPLHDDPRFEALLNDPKNNAPLD